MNRKFYLDKLPAVADVISQLPDDCIVCGIRDAYIDRTDRMLVQILYHDGIVPDRADEERGWAEKDFDGLFGDCHASVIVGWCLPDEGEDE